MSTQHFDAGPVVVDTVPANEHIYITARGEIDVATIEPFDAAIDEATRHPCGLVIDLCGTSFLGVCAVSSIVRASRQLQDQRNGVTVLVGTQLQRQLFVLSGVDSLVTVVDRSAG